MDLTRFIVQWSDVCALSPLRLVKFLSRTCCIQKLLFGLQLYLYAAQGFLHQKRYQRFRIQTERVCQ